MLRRVRVQHAVIMYAHFAQWMERSIYLRSNPVLIVVYNRPTGFRFVRLVASIATISNYPAASA